MGHIYYTKKVAAILAEEHPPMDRLISKLDENITGMVIDQLLTFIQDQCAAGHSVQLTGFGSFVSRDKLARLARNPATGEPVHIPAKRVMLFRAAKAKA